MRTCSTSERCGDPTQNPTPCSLAPACEARPFHPVGEVTEELQWLRFDNERAAIRELDDHVGRVLVRFATDDVGDRERLLAIIDDARIGVEVAQHHQLEL